MSAFKDLTGQVFGELTVVEMLHNYNNTGRMYCRCEGIDGNEYIIRQDALRSGATKYVKGACKTGAPRDITGQKYGKLTVLYPTDERGSNGNIVWHCQCSCGRFIDVPWSSLNRGHTTSCGCNKRSQSEQLIVKFLDSLGVSYVTEKHYDDLFNPEGTKHLYFDFYFPQYNAIFEYDGELHFEAFDHFGGEQKLKQIQACDALKDKYCQKNGIKLVRMNYKHKTEEIIQALESIIQPVTITA